MRIWTTTYDSVELDGESCIDLLGPHETWFDRLNSDEGGREYKLDVRVLLRLVTTWGLPSGVTSCARLGCSFTDDIWNEGVSLHYRAPEWNYGFHSKIPPTLFPLTIDLCEEEYPKRSATLRVAIAVRDNLQPVWIHRPATTSISGAIAAESIPPSMWGPLCFKDDPAMALLPHRRLLKQDVFY